MEKILQQYGVQKQAKVLLGNRLEDLFAGLKSNLCGQPLPFSKKFVVVPSRQMQEWVCQKLAFDQEIGIAAGINFLFLKPAFEKLSCLLAEGVIPSMPQELALTLHLITSLEEIANQDKSPLFASLKEYINKGDSKKRIVSLSQKLAPLFVRYFIYGERAANQWMNNPGSWQEALWKKIFLEQKSLLKKAVADMEIKKNLEFDISIHFFGFSHIPPVFFDFFEKAALHVPVLFYHFSPCQMFWSDHLSFRERKRLVKFYQDKKVTASSLEAFEQFLDEENFLLGNLGKVGREFARLLEEREIEVKEGYTTFDVQTKATLLITLQRDLLFLGKTPRHLIDEVSPSIEIHIHASRNREIEELKRYIAKHALDPQDIVVLAPDIALYEPFIRAHFGDAYPFKITDLPAKTKNRLLEGFYHLLTLPNKRWSAPALLELFDHPLFQRKHHLTAEEVSNVRRWVLETGIRWGVSKQQRDQILQNSLNDPQGTWEEGFKELLLSLTRWEEELLIDFTEVDLLGKIIALVRSLEDDLKILSDGSLLTLAEWTLFLQMLLESYFEGESQAKKIQEKLQGIADSVDVDQKFLFSAIFPLIEKELEKERVTLFRHQLQAATFSSMHPSGVIPSKMICLLGMDQESFPRKDPFYALNLLAQEEHDYCPSRLDFDRYLFLEVLFSARERLLISYVGKKPSDQSEIPSSLVVQELSSYVNERYGISIKEMHHSLFSCVSASKDKTRAFSFFFYSVDKMPPLPQGEYEITLHELKLLARSPLRYYLQHRFGLNFYAHKTVKEEEEFTLSHLSLWQLRNCHTHEELACHQKRLQRQGEFPIGNFLVFAAYTLEKHLHFEEIDRSAFFSCALSHLVSRPTQIEEKHLFPPLKVALSEKCICTLTGHIAPLCSEGVVAFEKKSVKMALLFFPDLAVLKALELTDGNLFFARDKTQCASFFKNPRQTLSRILEYALLAREVPIPLSPDWIIPILKKDAKTLDVLIEKSFVAAPFLYPDPALKWAFAGDKHFTAEMVIAYFEPVLQKIYGELIDAWF